MVRGERQPFERLPVTGDQPPLLVVLVEHRAARNIIVVRVSGDPLPAFDRENPRQAVLPAQCLRPECGSGRQQEQYKKSSFHRYLQYYLAIIYLIRPASRPGFSFPTLRPWISVLQILRPGFTPGFAPRQLSCPLPGRARNSVPPRGNFGLAARIFSSPAARPGSCYAPPRLRPRPDPPRSASRGDFCLAARQHLKRPPPRSRDIRSQTRRSKNEAGAGNPHRRNRLRPIHIAYRRASRNRAGHRASRIGLRRIRQSPLPALRRCEPFTCVWYAAAPPAGGGAPRSAAGTSTSCPCSVWRHWPA